MQTENSNPQPNHETANSSPTPGSHQNEKKGLTKTVKIVILAVSSFIVLSIVGLIAFFVLITTVVNNATKDATAVSDQVVGYIQTDNPDAIYVLANESFTLATSEAELAALIETISPELQGDVTITDRSVQTKDDVTRAAIVYSISTAKGERYVRVVLEKDGDRWQVLNFIASPNQLEPVTE